MKENLVTEDRERKSLLLLAVLVFSLALHAVLMVWLSDCSFTSFSDDLRASRKWTKDLPVMQVDHVKGDPFAAAADALGRPAAAPVTEDEYTRVARLSEDLPPNAAPPRPPEEAAKLNEAPAPTAPKPDAPAVVPREKIALVETVLAPDDKAALPRVVIPDVPRMKGAPDLTPPVDLLARPLPPQAAADASSLPAFDTPAPPTVALGPQGGGLLGDRNRLLHGGNSNAGSSAFDLGAGALARNAVDKAKRRAEQRAAESAREEEEKKRDQANARLAENAPTPVPRVDDKLVARAKEAVRALRDESVEQGAPFEEHVRCDLAWWVDPEHPQFKYFRVRMSSRAESPLPVVPKDIVYLLDVSGSIGSDRLRSCRNFVGEHIRTLNPGDRFNLAMFRNRVTYLFDNWREPGADALRAADDWLAGLAAHGGTDVFATLKSVLALQRSPERPLVALFVTDGEATSGMTRSAEIISRFSELNDGLFSIYMYGVKEKANAYLMDMLARGNRGGWARHEGFRFRAAAGLPEFTAQFAEPVLSDISVTFASTSRTEAYPRRVTNLYRAQPIEIWGLCPAGQKEIVFNMRGLNGRQPFENMFRLSFAPQAQLGPEAKTEWARRRLYAQVEEYTLRPTQQLMRDLKLFSDNYGVAIPYEKEIK